MKKTIVLVLLFAVTTIAQVATTRPYPIDNNHSTVGFSVPIFGGLSQVKGKFTDSMRFKKSKQGIATPKPDIDLIKKRLKIAEEHYKTYQAEER